MDIEEPQRVFYKCMQDILHYSQAVAVKPYADKGAVRAMIFFP